MTFPICLLSSWHKPALKQSCMERVHSIYSLLPPYRSSLHLVRCFSMIYNRNTRLNRLCRRYLLYRKSSPWIDRSFKWNYSPVPPAPWGIIYHNRNSVKKPIVNRWSFVMLLQDCSHWFWLWLSFNSKSFADSIGLSPVDAMLHHWKHVVKILPTYKLAIFIKMCGSITDHDFALANIWDLPFVLGHFISYCCWIERAPARIGHSPCGCCNIARFAHSSLFSHIRHIKWKINRIYRSLVKLNST